MQEKQDCAIASLWLGKKEESNKAEARENEQNGIDRTKEVARTRCEEKKRQSSCERAREALRIIYLFPFAIFSHFPSFPCVQGWERWSFIISTTTTTLPAQHCAYILCVTHALQPHWAGQVSPLALGLFVRQAHTHTHCVSPPLYPLFQPGRNGHFIHSHNTRGRRGYAHQQGEGTSFRGEGDDALKHSQQHPFHAFHQQPSRGSSGNGGVKCAVRSRPPGRVGRIRKGMIDFNAPIRNERAPRNVQMQTLLTLTPARAHKTLRSLFGGAGVQQN